MSKKFHVTPAPYDYLDNVSNEKKAEAFCRRHGGMLRVSGVGPEKAKVK